MVIDIGMAGEAVGGAVTAIGGIYAIVKRLMTNSKRKKEDYRNSILKEAKQEVNKLEKELEEKIKKVNFEVQDLRDCISKDIINLKENHAVELKNLSEKIELLREELKSQSSGILILLTKLVDK